MSAQQSHTNHEVTICLQGGAMLGPFNATWGGDQVSDIRELSKDYDAFLQGEPQQRFRYHLRDARHHLAHSLVIDFKNVSAIYDQVTLSEK